jgi:tRNA-2-methylthio-N6-dimethylallyladenosine synthase
MDKVRRIREYMPDCAITTDIITGFCSETEEEHQDTITLIQEAQFNAGYLFFYSERPGTLAARKYPDDVPEEIKKRRLTEVIEVQNIISRQNNLNDIGKTFEVLIEGNSKKSDQDWSGRNTHNKMLVFPKGNTHYKPGDFVQVKVTQATSATLIGEIIS